MGCGTPLKKVVKKVLNGNREVVSESCEVVLELKSCPRKIESCHGIEKLSRIQACGIHLCAQGTMDVGPNKHA